MASDLYDGETATSKLFYLRTSRPLFHVSVRANILHSHSIIIMHICNLFKAMATHNVVPDDFGLGIIIPLVKDKTGDIANLSNYRDITLIPVVSKLFECVLLNLCDDILVSD